MPTKEKTPARKAADARYESARESVLIRLTKEEAALLDAARGDDSRPSWVKAQALAKAKP